MKVEIWDGMENASNNALKVTSKVKSRNKALKYDDCLRTIVPVS